MPFKRGYIYFLFRKGQLLYIGQTRNLSVRLMDHRYFDIDMVRLIPCRVSMLCHYEQRLIRFFKPICNKHHNPAYSIETKQDYSHLPLRRRLKRSRKYTLKFEGKRKILIEAF